MLYGRRYLSALGRSFAAANVNEVVISRPTNGRLALVKVIATVLDGPLANPTVTLQDGGTLIGRWNLPLGDAKILIFAPSGLPISGDLVAQVSHTAVRLSAWAIEVTRDAT